MQQSIYLSIQILKGPYIQQSIYLYIQILKLLFIQQFIYLSRIRNQKVHIYNLSFYLFIYSDIKVQQSFYLSRYLNDHFSIYMSIILSMNIFYQSIYSSNFLGISINLTNHRLIYLSNLPTSLSNYSSEPIYLSRQCRILNQQAWSMQPLVQEKTLYLPQLCAHSIFPALKTLSQVYRQIDLQIERQIFRKIDRTLYLPQLYAHSIYPALKTLSQVDRQIERYIDRQIDRQNSIPATAVCSFNISSIEDAFSGQFIRLL